MIITENKKMLYHFQNNSDKLKSLSVDIYNIFVLVCIFKLHIW